MRPLLRSLLAWSATLALILLWLPLLSLVYVTDRHPTRRRTARAFRTLGRSVARLNRAHAARIADLHLCQPGQQYIVVCNHQSLADIPLLSHLPVDAKWLAKAELFRAPIGGWMMRLAGDIPVERGNPMGRALALRRALRALEQGCSVIVFPEGTRSREGRLQDFHEGAFYLAARSGVPILPVAVDGSGACLPRGSWKVGNPDTLRVRVLPPLSVSGLARWEIPYLRDQVRQAIATQIAEWRAATIAEVDAAADASEWAAAEPALSPGPA